ncbi:MAG: hypothetical protein U0R26_11905 [Solirubrobacterales bacterium]
MTHRLKPKEDWTPKETLDFARTGEAPLAADARAELDSAIASLAEGGVQLPNGETAVFFDAEDAAILLERRVDRGELAMSALVDEAGEVDSDAIASQLGSLLEGKPHLRADRDRVLDMQRREALSVEETAAEMFDEGAGDSDTRKGEGPPPSPEGLSVADHIAAKYGIH